MSRNIRAETAALTRKMVRVARISPDALPRFIEDVAHLLTTGEVRRRKRQYIPIRHRRARSLVREAMRY